MPKTDYVELGNRERIPILYEDRAAIALDKPPGWMLVPVNWQSTGHNLQAALLSSIEAGFFWARSRNLRFLRYVHRLDAETSGVLLFARSPGALEALSGLFESRVVDKLYLAVVRGVPRAAEWTCDLRLAPDPRSHGRVIVDRRQGKEALTHFQRLQTLNLGPGRDITLVEARPHTGRTHQIRVHLAATGCPVLGDELYGGGERDRPPRAFPLGLRSVELAYRDPFTRRPVRIEAPRDAFLRAFGFKPVFPTRATPPPPPPVPDEPPRDAVRPDADAGAGTRTRPAKPAARPGGAQAATRRTR